ncbi:retinoblastoma-binding protein 5 homolog isoform X2 [Pomacea canaliculata]|uniref:retinoblastoma-binding protein 5 homolog isoform X2 n=1 Tax=Pomacea canaliculata TaxID=400727 RepID=UPI000D72ECA1|nr:retinoblastoma-binding protein 5 homolog isoform X2 [Pomacea canaliculata]
MWRHCSLNVNSAKHTANGDQHVERSSRRIFVSSRGALLRQFLLTSGAKLKAENIRMNLELLESFGQNYPEDFDGALDCVSIAVTCAFNRQGTLLAVGCNDGRVVVWDFLTRGIAKIINAHVHPVCSLSWNRNGHKLLSAATDNTVSVWDVLSGENDRTYRFPSPVLKVQFHPRSSNQFLVCPLKHAAVLMNTSGSHQVIPLDDNDLNIIATFDRRGKYIYTGNAKGRILVFKTENLELVASFRVTTGTLNTTAIKSIEFARRGECFLVNSADRIIRVYESREVLTCGKDGEPEPIQKLQDLVNKTLWKKCCFSGDGEYIVAGSARQHSLYIWEKSVGNLVKILHGTKGELLLDVVWHPVRPIIASISSGLVSIWAQNQVENWSAFAPDFKELDENVEYDERESEFDLEDEDKEKVDTKGPDQEDTEVDVTTVEPIQAFVSSDEEDEDLDALMYLPVSPEVDEPEEVWQGTGDGALQDDGMTPAAAEKKRSHSNTDQLASSKKKKMKAFDVHLPDAPKDEIHPLLSANAKKSQENKSQPRKSRPQKSRSSRLEKRRERAKVSDPEISYRENTNSGDSIPL